MRPYNGGMLYEKPKKIKEKVFFILTKSEEFSKMFGASIDSASPGNY